MSQTTVGLSTLPVDASTHAAIPALSESCRARQVLIMSGGIGDFLHCLTRIDGFLEASGLKPSEFVIVVESTRPEEVKSVFALCLSEFDVRYTPARLHWTKTNPLLNPHSETDRAQRPSRLYLEANRAHVIEDWFLPFLAMRYPCSTKRLAALNVEDRKSNTVLVSSRDKGFPWWLDDASARAIRARLSGFCEILEIGTEDEHTGKFGRRIVTRSTAEALALACSARLMIGTDTGFVTIRELLQMPNIYCVSQFWKARFMESYGYWNDDIAATSKSQFAYDAHSLEAALDHFVSSDFVRLPAATD